jgi:hypothetical protein
MGSVVEEGSTNEQARKLEPMGLACPRDSKEAVESMKNGTRSGSCEDKEIGAIGSFELQCGGELQ